VDVKTKTSNAVIVLLLCGLATRAALKWYSWPGVVTTVVEKQSLLRMHVGRERPNPNGLKSGALSVVPLVMRVTRPNSGSGITPKSLRLRSRRVSAPSMSLMTQRCGHSQK